MTSFHVLAALSATAMVATVAAGVSFLMRPEPALAEPAGRSAALPSIPGETESRLSATFRDFQATLLEANGATNSMSGVWTSFDRSLRELDPSLPAVRSEKDAREVLARMSTTVDAMADDSAKATREVSTRVRAAVAMEIEARAADLAALKPKLAERWSEKLEKAIFFGRDLTNHLNGLDLVWIEDPKNFPDSGGFWAGKKEVTTSSWKSVTGNSPSMFSPPKKSEESDIPVREIIETIRSQYAPGSPQYIGINGVLGLPAASQQQWLGSNRTEKNRAVAAILKRRNANITDTSNFPGELVNVPSKDTVSPFLEKLPSTPDWGYRLPRKAEWDLLAGKVEGLRTPDLSEWLDDQPQPVDPNWKSNAPASPPAPGTVGFRVVYVPR